MQLEATSIQMAAIQQGRGVHISVLDDPERLGRGRGRGRRDGELPCDLGDTERDREREMGDREMGEREREKERLRFLLKKNCAVKFSIFRSKKRKRLNGT